MQPTQKNSPLPLHMELICPYCENYFNLGEKDPIHQHSTCPTCGKKSRLIDCLSDEVLFHELEIARSRLERIRWEMNERGDIALLFTL
jgi:hypothetical protein